MRYVNNTNIIKSRCYDFLNKSLAAFLLLKWGYTMIDEVISSKVIDFDNRLNSWNTMMDSTKEQNTSENKIQTITQWWNNYAINPRKNKIYTFNYAPNDVWNILEKYKISKLEKIYGMYYTLRKIFSGNIKLKEIQTKSGDYELSIMVENYMIVDDTIYDCDIFDCNLLDQSVNDKFFNNVS